VKKSLSTKLMYSFMAIIVVVIIGITAGTSYLIADYFFKTKEQELADKGREMADTIEYFVVNDRTRSTLMRYLIAVDRLVGARIWLFDANYNLIAASNIDSDLDVEEATGKGSAQGPNITKTPPADQPNFWKHTDTLAKELKEGTVSGKVKAILKDIYKGQSLESQIFHPYFKEQVILVGIPYGDKNNPQGAILLAEPLSGFEKFLRNVYIYTIIVGILALILALFMVRQLSLQIIKPLLSMKDTATAIASGDYSRKVEVDGEDEVAELGKAINELSGDISDYLAQLKKTDKIRNDFVANVSHELRTPITIIRGYNEIISDNMQDNPLNERYCQLIASETDRLERLVRGLLNISRLQAASKLTAAETEPLPMADIIRNVAEKLQVKADMKKTRIDLRLEEGTQIIGDGDQMVQLVLLLGDNAIKYSPEGSFVCYETKSNPDGSFLLAVTDNGKGIPESDLPFIFERFYKVDKSHSQSKTTGTGLGLAIAKEIIRMHGAKVEVHSKLGEGTRFEVTFPREKVVR
jgi:signal transduction histidine kinase